MVSTAGGWVNDWENAGRRGRQLMFSSMRGTLGKPHVGVGGAHSEAKDGLDNKRARKASTRETSFEVRKRNQKKKEGSLHSFAAAA